MKIFKFFAGFVILTLFGAGCLATQNAVQQNQNSQTQWQVYTNATQGIEFQYPPTAKNITADTKANMYSDVLVSYDLGPTVNDPEAKSVPEARMDVFLLDGNTKTQDGKPVINDAFYYEFGWTPQVDVSVQRETYGGYEFSRSTYSDAGAGNLYTTYTYTYPMGNNKFALFKFVIHSVNCGNYEGTGFKCISFDATRDTQLAKQILATAKLTPAATVSDSYTFTDGTIAAKTKYYEINVKYPVMNGGKQAVRIAFNNKIKAFVDSEVAQFKKDAQAAATYPGPGPWFINYYYNIPYNQNGLISVVMQKEMFTGGAHPNTTYKTYLYNTGNLKFLVLADLFKPGSDYLNVIAAYAKTQLHDKFLKDSGGDPRADQGWFPEGADPKTENYQYFNLTDKGINFIFPPYQVAAYAYGTQEQVVPVSTFKIDILPNGPLGFWGK